MHFKTKQTTLAGQIWKWECTVKPSCFTESFLSQWKKICISTNLFPIRRHVDSYGQLLNVLLKSPCIHELEDKGLWACTGGSKKLRRHTGTYGSRAGLWPHALSTLPSLRHQCGTFIQLAFLHLPHAHLNNGANCKNGEVIIKRSGKYANSKLHKLRGEQR